MTETIVVTDEGFSEARDRARVVLAAGGLVVAPSETMYALYASVEDPLGLQRLRTARGVGRDAPLTVAIHDARHLATMAEVPEAAERLIAAYWPGPMTLLCTGGDGARWQLGAREDSLAVRVPADAIALRLLAAAGPLACSAATTAGGRPPTTAAAAREALGDAVHLYLDGGERTGPASTVVDVTRDGATVVRAGAILAEHIRVVAAGGLAWGQLPRGDRVLAGVEERAHVEEAADVAETANVEESAGTVIDLTDPTAVPLASAR